MPSVCEEADFISIRNYMNATKCVKLSVKLLSSYLTLQLAVSTNETDQWSLCNADYWNTDPCQMTLLAKFLFPF